MSKTIEVDIYGQHLSLEGDVEEGYVQELTAFVEGQMDAISRGLMTSNPSKIAILAALNIADQLFRQERCRQAGEAEIERKATGLLKCIEAELETPTGP